MLAGYQILEELGKGTYGAVYRGCKEGGKCYALKEQRYEKDGALPYGFLREAAVLLNAQHPNLVRAYEVLFLPDRLVLVLECADMTLGKWLKQEHSNEEKLAVAFQLLCGLDFLHRKGVVHCDLKPENILMFKDGSVKIADLGLAIRDYGQELGYQIQSIWWRAPEVLTARERYDTSIDMWSLGAILYQLWTGKYLTTETNPDALLLWQQREMVTLLTQLQLPSPHHAELLTGCLTYSPSVRLTARTALKSPLFTTWQVPTGQWYTTPVVQPGTSDTLCRLKLAAPAYTLAANILTRCRKDDTATILGCAVIALVLLYNDWPLIPGYTVPQVRQLVQGVCQEIACSFYG